MKKTQLVLSLLATITLSLLAGCGAGTGAGPAPSATTVASPAASATPAPKPTASPTPVPKPANPEVIMATTTSTADSGLLDVLLPLFTKETGYQVKPIAVGSGAAMTMGERGEADVLFVHSPDAEVAFMAAGHGAVRKLVMHNDFIIVGPAADPAKIKGVKSANEAMTKIAQAKALFLSRADNSGTHALELKLWKAVGLDPTGQSWYQQTGQGMGATLNVASEKNGYTISDRATYLATKNLSLSLLVEGDPALLNIYHVITVNPKKSDKINAAGATAFMDWVVSTSTQKVIGQYGADKYGQPLFFPDAGKPEYQ